MLFLREALDAFRGNASLDGAVPVGTRALGRNDRIGHDTKARRSVDGADRDHLRDLKLEDRRTRRRGTQREDLCNGRSSSIPRRDRYRPPTLLRLFSIAGARLECLARRKGRSRRDVVILRRNGSQEPYLAREVNEGLGRSVSGGGIRSGPIFNGRLSDGRLLCGKRILGTRIRSVLVHDKRGDARRIAVAVSGRRARGAQPVPEEGDSPGMRLQFRPELP